ncbi:MAG: hypothetical protein ACP6IU_12170 [Candidatus Asgardarchaeia archaeon]
MCSYIQTTSSYPPTVHESRRKISFVEKLGGITTNPRETFGLLVNYYGSEVEATVVFFTYTIVKFFLITVAMYKLIPLFRYSPILSSLEPIFNVPATLLLLISIGLCVASIMSWLINGVITHLFAKHLFHGVGNLREALLLYRYIGITNVFPIVGSLVIIAWPSYVTFNIFIINYLVYILWKALLTVIAVEETYGISEVAAFVSGVAIPLMVGLMFLL